MLLEMNLMLLPILILFPLSLIEFIFPNNERMNKQVYFIAFAISYFIVAIKYYYGPDIAIYVNLYDSLSSPIKDLINPPKSSLDTERLFIFFFSFLKSIGCSYWFCSVIITTIYFAAIYNLFTSLNKYKTFALFLIVLFDANLLFFEFRQNLTVALFLFSLSAYYKRSYFVCVLLAVLSFFIHKSAIFVYMLMILLLFFQRVKVSKTIFLVASGLLLVFLFLPIDQIIIWIISKTPASTNVIESVKHHLMYTKTFQIIFFVYAIVLLLLIFSVENKDLNSKYAKIVALFFIVVSISYRDWFFLNRLRSYFLPVVIVYLIPILSQSKSKQIWISKLAVCLIYLYSINYARGIWLSNYYSEAKLLNSTTIFSRFYKSENEIRRENMRKASYFFQKEYMKNNIEEYNKFINE